MKYFSGVRWLTLLLSATIICGLSSCNKPEPDNPNNNHQVDPNPNTDPGTNPGSDPVVPPVTEHFPTTPEEIKDALKATQDLARTLKSIVDDSKKNSSDGQAVATDVAVEVAKLDGVASAKASSDGKSVAIEQTNKVFVNLMLDTYDFYGEGGTKSLYSVPKMNLNKSPQAKPSITVPDGSKKALLLSPYQSPRANSNMGGRQVDINSVRNLLAEAGYSLRSLEDNEVRIDHFYGDTLAKYELVLIRTHGGRGLVTADGKFRSTVIGSGEEIDLNKAEDFDGNIALAIINGITTYCATTQWLEATTHRDYPGTIVYAGACESYNDDDIANYFLGHQAAAYAGDRRSTDYRLNNEYLYGLTRYLTSGYNFEEAAVRVTTDQSTIDIQNSLNSSDPGCRADCLRASVSPDVYLFDPYPYNLKFGTGKNGEGELSWDIHKSTGEYKYTVKIGEKETTVDKSPMIFNPPKNGHYEWKVTAQLFKGNELLSSYESDLTSFDFGDFPDLKASFYNKSFSDVIIGQAPCDTVALTNTGKSDAVIMSVSCPDGFTVDLQKGDIVGPGAQKDVSIMFEPKEEKTYSGTLVIEYGPGNGLIEISLYGTGYKKSGPALDWEPRLLNFGDVKVSKTYKKTLTITNIGNKDAHIQTVAHPAEYSVSLSQTYALKPNKSMTIDVTLKPTEIKDYSCQLIIQSDAVQGDIRVPVKAYGIENISGKLEVSPSSINFYTVYIGNSKEKEASLTNTGKGIVVLDPPVCPEGYSTDLKGGTVIDPGETVDFKIKFAPTKEDSYRRAISFPSDADGEEPYIALYGTGKATAKAVLDSDYSSISFGQVDIGQAQNYTVTIYNNGKAKATISKISCPDGFSANIESKTLNAGASTKMTVSFKPTKAKTYSGDLSITSDAQNTLSISLKGEGREAVTPPSGAKLVLSDASIDFGEVLSDDRAYKQFLISNVGDVPAIIESITSSHHCFTTDFSGPATIKAGASLTIKVQFDAYVQGQVNATLSITNDTDNSPITLPVSATVKDIEGAVITWADDRIHFGDVKVGESATVITSIANGTTYKATVSDVTVPEGFSVDLKKGTTIPGSSATFVTVTFTPTEVKTYGGALTVKSDAVNGEQTMALFGNGVIGEPESVKVTGVTLNKSSLSLYVGQSETLVETVLPEDAADKSVTWSSTYSEVATVDSNGKVTAVAAGSTTIIATTNDGGFTARCSVTVSNVGTLTLNDKEMTMVGVLGHTSTWEFKISNDSQYSATIESISCPQGFTTDFNAPVTLKPGYYLNVNVRFKPTTNKTYSGKIQISTNSSLQPLEVDITGEIFNHNIDGEDTDFDMNDLFGKRLHVGVGGLEQVGDYIVIDRRPDHGDPWEEDAKDWYVTIVCPDNFCYSQDLRSFKKGIYSFKIPYNTYVSNYMLFSPTEYCKDYRGRFYFIIFAEGMSEYLKLDCFGSSRAYMWCTGKVDFGSCAVNKKWSKNITLQTEQTYDYHYPSSIKAHILSVTCPDGFSTDLMPGTELYVENREWVDNEYKVYFQPTEAKVYEGDILIETDSEQGTLKVHVYGKGA